MRSLIAAGAGIALILTGCTSSKPSSSPAVSSSAHSRGTYTIGLLTDQTGLGASASKTSVQGVQAGLTSLATAAGYRIKFVTADTTSAPAGALSAAQKLVEQDHVFA